MNSKLKRILTTSLVAVIFMTNLVLPVSALDVNRIDNTVTTKESDTYKDVMTLNAVSDWSSTSKDWIIDHPRDGHSDDAFKVPSFSNVVNLNENSSNLLEEFEKALLFSGLTYKNTDQSKAIYYDSEYYNSDKFNLLMYGFRYDHKNLLSDSNTSKGASILGLFTALGTDDPNSGGDKCDAVRSAVIISDSQNVLFRFYIYDSTNGVPYTIDGRNGMKVVDLDITKIVSTLSSKTIDATVYPLTSYLCSAVKGYEGIVRDELQLKQIEIFHNYVNNTNNDLGIAITAYNEHLEKQTEYKYNAPNSPYGPHAMYQYFVALYNSGIMDGLEDPAKWEGTVIQPTDTDGNTIDMVGAAQAANEVVDKYSKTVPFYTQKDIVSNASMFNDLIRYRYGVLSGAPIYDPASPSTAGLKDSSVLSGLLLDASFYKGAIINPQLFEQFPTIKKFKYDDDNGYQVENSTYNDIMASVQALEYYAENSKYSGINEKQEDAGIYWNEQIEDILIADESKPDEDLEPIQNATTIRHALAYIQIKDGLDWLGLKPWTKELTYICETAEKLRRYPLESAFGDYDTDSETEPLKRFFSIEGGDILSVNYMTGVALSATYIPMQTNLYDPTSIRILENEDWLGKFHMKYGFYRKALMIDNNVNAAVDSYVTGSRDTSRPAMLRDLLEYNKDIVLYIDDNFYNTKEVAEITNKAYERLANTEQAGQQNGSIPGSFDSFMGNNIEQILKTGPVQTYSSSIRSSVKEYNTEDTGTPWWDLVGKVGEALSSMKEAFFTNGLILSSRASTGTDGYANEILRYLDESEYTVKQPYAVVSSIYRDKEVCNKLNKIAEKPLPVFVSSPALFNIQNVPTYEFNSIYNYYMLRNLEASIGVDYKTTLDLDNPLYIDIYGNIITESGLVVIPAASNATLDNKANPSYSPYTLGFMCLYSNGDNITTKNEDVKKRLTNFQLLDDGVTYVQKNYEFNGVPVNPQRPSIADAGLIKVLYDNQVALLENKGYNFDQRMWLITEVLRGAPLENIDKEVEGIVGKRDISKYGLYMSWKLDEIADMLLPTTNGNSLISMPNLAFMDGIEYLVLFAFKLMLLFFVAYLMYRVYIDAVGGRLGLKTLWQCVSTIVIFCVSVWAIPGIIQLSYNEPNKIFLQDEIKYINLLNYEKSLEGREISAVGVTEPKSQTKLFLKLDTVNVPWYEVLQDVMFAPVGETLGDLYDEELKSNMLYGYDDVQVVNDGVYIDVEDIFDSSTIMYNKNQHFLHQNMNNNPTASYFIPYYYIMDNMLQQINTYNLDNGIINITTKIQSDGSVRTMGMIGDYMLSEYFLLDAVDPLGLYNLYGIDTNMKESFITDKYDDPDLPKKSMWYVGDLYEAADCSSRIDQLYSHMRSYVAQNRSMIGRVTDETFLKTMMLDISMEYNNLFRIPAAKGIEVFSIDSRDLIRLSVTDKNMAVVNSSQSFGKFIYEQAGGLGVILTAILLGVYFIASIVKPALVIFLIAVLVYSVLVKRMITGDRGKTVEGLLYTLSILVIVNSTYALIMKLGMSLPNLGLNPVISIIGQIAIQAGYLWFVFKVAGAIFKDFANFGYNAFHTGMLAVTGAVTGGMASIRDKATYSKEQQEYMESAKMQNAGRENQNHETLREEMEARDKKREESREDTAFVDDVFGDTNNK